MSQTMISTKTTLLLCCPEDGLPLIRVSEPALIGRLPDCEIIQLYPDVSRRHARLYQEGGSWYIYDLDSLNGTRINDQLIENGNHALLIEGDVLKVSRFDSYVVRFERD